MDGTELLLDIGETPETFKIIITGFSSERAERKLPIMEQTNFSLNLSVLKNS